MSPSRYPVLTDEARDEVVIQKSRFIATLAPVSTVAEAQAFIQTVAQRYPDANHNCWAYVVGPPGSTSHIGLSDDGEPHNTAGRPMLNVLLHADVGDIAAVVTRYFGGIKLGRGGLVRAYGQAVQGALDNAERREKVDWAHLEVILAYADAPAVERILPAFEAEKLGETFAADVQYQLRLPVEKQADFIRAIEDATRGQALVESASDQTSGPDSE